MGNNAVSMFTPNAGMMGAANAAMRAGGKQAFMVLLMTRQLRPAWLIL